MIDQYLFFFLSFLHYCHGYYLCRLRERCAMDVARRRSERKRCTFSVAIIVSVNVIRMKQQHNNHQSKILMSVENNNNKKETKLVKTRHP